MNLGQIIVNPVDATDPGHYRIDELNRINGRWVYVAHPINDLCRYKAICGGVE